MFLKYRLSTFLIFTFLIFTVGIIVASLAYAQTNSFTYPIAELGDCESRQDCFDYCDQLVNIASCTNFAEAHGIVSASEAERARMLATVNVGPNGCTTQSACEAYCHNLSNIDECTTFAQNNNLLSEKELEKIRMITEYRRAGGMLPGGCSTRAECMAYCGWYLNYEDCQNFAYNVGLISEDEWRAMVSTRGEGPGGCINEEECEAYCAIPENRNECIGFSLYYLTPDIEVIEERRQKAQEMWESVSPDVQECITNEFGSLSVTQMLHGLILAPPEILEACGVFDGPISMPIEESINPYEGLLPEVIACAEGTLGMTIPEAMEQNPESIAPALDSCSSAVQEPTIVDDPINFDNEEF